MQLIGAFDCGSVHLYTDNCCQHREPLVIPKGVAEIESGDDSYRLDLISGGEHRFDNIVAIRQGR